MSKDKRPRRMDDPVQTPETLEFGSGVIFLGYQEKKGSYYVENAKTPEELACNKYWDRIAINALPPMKGDK